MSTKLPSYLFPKGRSASEPDLMPNVLDSDGNSVLFTSSKRKTTEGTVVDLGDSPNSNNGDPLRTAFAKINNFIEATYWWDEGINNKFKDLDSELRDGLFIYTDSDQRASLSLSNNSKLYFRGTPNQIEMNITRTESPNNPYDFDSEVSINFQLTETVNISTLNVKEHATFDSDVHIKRSLTVDSDVRVGGRLNASGPLVAEILTVNQEANFHDDVFFMDNAYFDSDVMIAGNLTVNGTTTAVNSQNLEVRDNLIVLNYNQTTPFNDIGLIFTRYDSDNVSATNWNTALVWDELTDQFMFAQTQSSGIQPNPTLTQQYMHIGQTVEFFDSDNATRMVWNKTQARLSILNKDGSEAFAFDADSGQMEGNGTIDAGLY